MPNTTGALEHLAPRTAPLSPSGLAALRSLELRLAPAHVFRAVTRYRNASARTAELSLAADSRTLTVAEFDVLAAAQDTMRESKTILAEAGQLHLIEVAA